ncbi:MAG: macrolide export ATP-binding/permease protein MacB [Alphaproteobacteria bacterium]|nr:MAG: macrolide export ATP-binding/permease protein MacB [Alphaproteobacteria bacterium]
MSPRDLAPRPRPLIELEGIGKIYRNGAAEVRALDDVSLTIRRGEFVAIIGQSGSGKSTLMQIIGCLDRPSAGSYRVDGRDVADLGKDELAALRRETFGFVFQRYNLLASATAAENVEIPAIYAGRGRADRLERAHRLLARLGLAERVDHRPGELSGGQQQRVSIARALMNDAPVILADEPTGALDSQSGEEMLALLAELHASGRTILLITHDAEVAARAERQVTIRDGRIVADERRITASPRPAPDPAPTAAPVASGRSLLSGLGEAVRMALRSLRVNLFRTALTLLGIVIGTAAVIAMLAIGQGSRADILDRIQSMGSNLLIVRPGAPGLRPSGEVATLTAEDAAALQELDNVAVVVPSRSTSTTLRYGNIDYRTSVQGAWPGYTTARDWALDEGGFFTDADLRGYAPVVVLGRTIVRNLFPDGSSPVGRYVLIGNVPFEVIGVLAPKGATAFGSDQDDIAVVPLTTAAMRLFGKSHVSDITVKVSDAAAIDATQEAVRELLLGRHRTEDFQIRNTAAILETVQATQDSMTLLLGSVAAISLFVGGIGVMNIMLVSVTERTREIGIRMATGARARDILLQFNAEALVVCAIGGLAGIGVGLAAAVIAGSFGMSIVLSPAPALLAFACSFATGLLFGYLPARKAAHLDPVVALASE